jgi:16S rRNA (cytosine1402-N4)-methyltransferase
MGSQHIPVLVEEVMNLLRCEAHKTYVDATVGGGGHALEILKRTSPDGIVIGIDWGRGDCGSQKGIGALW